MANDDNSMSLGQKVDGPGQGLSKGRNSDSNLYGYKGKTRVQEGSEAPSGAEGVRGFAGQDGSHPGNEYPLGSRWNPLSDKNLRPEQLLSSDFKQPKFTDYAGGKTAKDKRWGSEQGFIDGGDAPTKSRQNDWRGNK